MYLKKNFCLSASILVSDLTTLFALDPQHTSVGVSQLPHPRGALYPLALVDFTHGSTMDIKHFQGPETTIKQHVLHFKEEYIHLLLQHSLTGNEILMQIRQLKCLNTFFSGVCVIQYTGWLYIQKNRWKKMFLVQHLIYLMLDKILFFMLYNHKFTFLKP